MIEPIAWLIPLLPLLAAAWVGLGMAVGINRGEAWERHTALVSVGAAGIALALLFLVDLTALVGGAPGQLAYGTWFHSGQWHIPLSLTLDPLGLSLASLAGFLCLATIKFSVNYMHREEGFQRFFFGLNLFTGAMLLILLAGNAVLTFVGWELAGLSSYLLIGYLQQSPEATRNATRVFVTNRIGDAGFILGIALSLSWLGGVEWPLVNGAGAELKTLTAGLIGAGFVLAALVKSAQIPFAPWIGRALEGPTPSSAVFYGAVMVHAGVYLLIRLQPLIERVPMLLALLLILGLLTVAYGWLGALVQTDVKSSLQFAVTTQVGLMFVWCGLGWFELAAWHLAAHAALRAWQFLHAPALMHLAANPAAPAPAWLLRSPALHMAAIQRFWLDNLADWLLIRPTRNLGVEVQEFDEKVVDRIVGLPAQAGAVSAADDQPAKARGLAGRLLEGIADALYWFERRLVLRGGGEGLFRAIQMAGGHLSRIDGLLSEPRYLLLMIMATFVVIL